jgi:hypothetical protein
MSIIELTPWLARTPASPTRGVGLMYRRIASRSSSDQERPDATRSPAADPPSAPVTTSRSPGRAPLRRAARPGTTSPVTVTTIETSSPPERLPPTSDRANSSQHSRMPPASSTTHAASIEVESVKAQSAKRGLAAIAATSLTLTAIAL